MKKNNEKILALKNVISTEIKKKLYEEYARSIPGFATLNAASNCTEEMKHHFVRYIIQKTNNPKSQRELRAIASVSLVEMEKEIKTIIEKYVMQFINNS